MRSCEAPVIVASEKSRGLVESRDRRQIDEAERALRELCFSNTLPGALHHGSTNSSGFNFRLEKSPFKAGPND